MEEMKNQRGDLVDRIVLIQCCKEANTVNRTLKIMNTHYFETWTLFKSKFIYLLGSVSDRLTRKQIYTVYLEILAIIKFGDLCMQDQVVIKYWWKLNLHGGCTARTKHSK